MKKQRKYSQLKEQDKSPERTNNETDHTSLLNPEFKKEVIKILKELRKSINRNADCYCKELERIKVNSSKLDNSIAEIKTNKELQYQLENKVLKWEYLHTYQETL